MRELAGVMIEVLYYEDVPHKVLEHFNYLPSGTPFYLFTEESNIDSYKKLFKKFKFPVTVLSYNPYIETPLEISHQPLIQNLKQDPVRVGILNYCITLTKPEFWKQFFEYRRVLIFQRDSGLLRKGIEEFYEYDYVGAPCYSFYQDRTIQNGGLSLRNPRIMEYIGRMYGWNSDLPELYHYGQYSTSSFFAEDIFFCIKMIKYGIGNLAPLDASKKFSVESKFYPNTLGYHNIYTYLSEKEINLVLNS